MSTTHTIGSLETYEPEDKSFSKHTIKIGTGDTQPNDGSTCTVFITPIDTSKSGPQPPSLSQDKRDYVTLIADQTVEAEDLAGYKIGEDCEVTIGEGDSLLSELLDQVVISMKEGETGYVKAKVDAKGHKVGEFDVGKKALKFNMTLKSFNRAADPAELEQDERMEHAQHHKDKGTSLFKSGKLEFSVKRYHRALRFLDDMEIAKDIPDHLTDQHRTLKCQCYLNLGACYLKLEKYEKVVSNCNHALSLDPASTKGLYRRGQAYLKLHKYTEAKADLIEAQKGDPKNKAVISELRTVEGLIKKEKDMYKKMFS